MKWIIAVGEGQAGKTSLICSFLKLEWRKYDKVLIGHFVSEVVANGKKEKLGLFDIPYHLRFLPSLLDLYCSMANAIVIVFPVDNRDKFEMVRSIWVPEILKRSTNVPYIIVGTKTDLRLDAKIEGEENEIGQSLVTKEEGKAMADDVNAIEYLECSALKYEDATNVFHTVFRIMRVEPVVETNMSSKKPIDTSEKNCTTL